MVAGPDCLKRAMFRLRSPRELAVEGFIIAFKRPSA
jgi:hypothetical protein